MALPFTEPLAKLGEFSLREGLYIDSKSVWLALQRSAMCPPEKSEPFQLVTLRGGELA
jgi:hypothetical protein